MGKTKLVLILLLHHAVSEGARQPRKRYLTNLIEGIYKERPIETILMLQHHQDKNCPIQDWNPDGIPILRVNEIIEIEMRRQYNTMALALVCMEEPSHLNSMLNSLAKSFDHSRHVRILLWMQGNPTEDFIKQSSNKAEEHKFLNMVIVGYHPTGEVSIHCLYPFPSPRFERTDNVSWINGSIFATFATERNFQGKKAMVLPKLDIPFNIMMYHTSPTASFPIIRIEDKQIIEFALKYNLTLELAEKHDSNSNMSDPYFDIKLNPHFVSKSDLLERVECVNAFTVSSLMVVVPCATQRSIASVFRKLDIRTWFLYILCVYATFVVVETAILVASHRISGHSYRLTNLNPCVNMRAFSAILGLPFPIGPRMSISLRLLFLAMSIFGMVFSYFFSCKLSSLLTKHPLQPQVENLEQLQQSGMTVIAERHIQSFIETEIDEEFSRRNLLNVTYMDTLNYAQALYSAKKSLSFIVNSEYWNVIDSFQQRIARKTLCASKNLSIIKNLPRMYKMQKNSIYRWPLTQFFLTFFESGIPSLWIRNLPYNVLQRLNITVQPKFQPAFAPLSLHHLKWLGWVLGCGYGLATLVFLVEIYIYGKCEEKD